MKWKNLKISYKPIRISIDDVGAGYDILSFERNGDKKYIELNQFTRQIFGQKMKLITQKY